jgi:beta-phosphoglucomutase-like phosphatase (HAD superfamily)
MEAKPSCCAVVEDTASGITAAVSAGMRALGYVADSDEAALRQRPGGWPLANADLVT